jgi:hypothetical protein
MYEKLNGCICRIYVYEVGHTPSTRLHIHRTELSSPGKKNNVDEPGMLRFVRRKKKSIFISHKMLRPMLAKFLRLFIRPGLNNDINIFPRYLPATLLPLLTLKNISDCHDQLCITIRNFLSPFDSYVQDHMIK